MSREKNWRGLKLRLYCHDLLSISLSLCLGVSLLVLGPGSGISHPVETKRLKTRTKKKKDGEAPVSAWEPEGSCRDRERRQREDRGNQRGDHAVRKRSSGKAKSGRFCPHLYPESVLCRIWSGVGGLCSTMGASSDKVRGCRSGSGQGPCRCGVWFSPLMGLETEF